MSGERILGKYHVLFLVTKLIYSRLVFYTIRTVAM
jgi:hypothetical protein